MKKILVPADVPSAHHETFIKNYNTLTHNGEHCMIFAADQKLEHLNKDFYGNGIALDALHPEHIFKIAQQGTIGALATHLGLIARYARQYPTIPYIAKLNGKTDLHDEQDNDPISAQLWHIDDVLAIQKEAGITMLGIGITIYLGSDYEAAMLEQAARAIFTAHQHGLLAVVWAYPRGHSIENESNPDLIVGACGIAHSLGADFVKVKAPNAGHGKTSEEWFAVATAAAGNTKVICAGGEQRDPKEFLKTVAAQLCVGKTAGCAIGRNIFQKSLPEAVKFTRAVHALVYENKTLDQALELL